MKLNFNMLSIEDTASILNWSSKENGGILPLSEATLYLYPELKDRIDLTKDNTKIICNLIKDRIESFHMVNKRRLKEYESLWNKYHDKFIKIMEDYFKVSINKNFYAFLGDLPVCPRFIEGLSFYFDLCDEERFIDICMHEICHFYFFEKCKKIFKNWKYEDFDNPSLLWYLSEIVIDAILNRKEVQFLFDHQFRSYDNFYDIYLENKCIVDIIKDIFDNNDIESSIKKSLQFLKDNEPEFGSKCTLKSK